MTTKRLLKPEDYTVTWLCALPLSEAVAAVIMLDEEHRELPQIGNDENTYTYGSIGDHNIVIACMPPGQPGKVSASRLVQSLPTSFPNLKIQLFVGIGGGIPCNPPSKNSAKDIHLGDVVVGWADETGAPAVIQYDLVRTTGKVKEMLSHMDKPDRRLLSALGKMLTARALGRKFFDSHLERFTKASVKGFAHPGPSQDTLYQSTYPHSGSATCEDCDSTKVVKRESRQDPMFHQGTIVSGDTVVRDAQLRDEIRQQCHGAKCVEMEAAGVMDQTHCLVIRGIADYADSHKNQIWQPFAAATAAAFAREFLLTVQPSALAEMKRVEVQLNAMSESNKRDEILEWLSPLQFGPRLNEMLGRRQEGTGTWLLESQVFTAWLKGDTRAIWCPGMPGAGKTILASTIIEHLRNAFQGTSNIGIGYIYCIYNETRQNTGNFLASLLHLLCRQNCALSPGIVASHAHHARFNTRPAVPELSRLLESQIRCFTKVFVVVDALDECPHTDGTREALLSVLQELPSNAHLLITSRPDAFTEKEFAGAVPLEISAHEDDVIRYLTARMDSDWFLKSHITADPSLRALITETVARKTRGMFLLAKLHMDSLASESSPRSLRRALDSLPDGLSKTYDEAMLRIQSRETTKDFVNKILSWVAFAQRPMTINELRCALAIEKDDSYLDKEALPKADFLLSVCGGLIVVDESEIVRFIHFTAQDYFARACHLGLSSAHIYLATVCITYLSFSTFGIGPCWVSGLTVETKHNWSKYQKVLDLVRKRLQDNVLLSYVSVHWGDHVRECGNQDYAIHTSTLQLLKRRPNISCSIEIACCLHSSPWYLSGGNPFHAIFLKDVAELHVAAGFGFEKLTEDLLQQGVDIDAQDSNGWTSLHIASANGHISVIKTLLGKGANRSLRTKDGYEAVYLAAIGGHESATSLLLNKLPLLPNTEELIREVAWRGHSEVLRCLLKHLGTRKGAHSVGIAIREALKKGQATHHIGTLLEGAEDLETYDLQPGLGMALDYALYIKDYENAHLLLDYRVDLIEMTCRKEVGRGTETLLHRFTTFGAAKAVKLLLDHHADIEAVDSGGNRPIHLAASGSMENCTEMLRLLLEEGADVNAYGSMKQTPLMIVSKEGIAEGVKLLLGSGASILAKDEDNRSAIEWAVLKGHPHVVGLLLTHQKSAGRSKGLLALCQLFRALKFHNGTNYSFPSRNDFEPQQSEDQNPPLSNTKPLPRENLGVLLLLVHSPSDDSDETVIRTFINMGAKVQASYDNGNTALHRAGAYGHVSMINLALDHGANIDAGWLCNLETAFIDCTKVCATPLNGALQEVGYDTARLLIEKGIDFERGTEYGGTPLMVAISNRDKAMVRLLLDSGADPSTSTSYSLWLNGRRNRTAPGSNALHFATYKSSDLEIMRLLIAKCTNLDAKDDYGTTPLLLAVRTAKLGAVKLFLEYGADPTAVEETTKSDEHFCSSLYGQDILEAMRMWKCKAEANGGQPAEESRA